MNYQNANVRLSHIERLQVGQIDYKGKGQSIHYALAIMPRLRGGKNEAKFYYFGAYQVRYCRKKEHKQYA